MTLWIFSIHQTLKYFPESDSYKNKKIIIIIILIIIIIK